MERHPQTLPDLVAGWKVAIWRRLFGRNQSVPPVYYVVDDERWVQVQRFRYLMRYLPEYPLELVTIDRFLKLWQRRPHGIAAYVSSWRLLHPLWKASPERFSKESCRSLIVGVTSHSNIGGGLNPELATSGRPPEDAFRRAVAMLSNFRAVTVNSLILRDLLKDSVSELLYCPNGVDVGFFSPGDRPFDPRDIKIGWIGKLRSAKNIAAIEEACATLAAEGFSPKLVKVPKTASEDDLMSSGQMRDYYRSIDYYLCASWDEGTPNPALEAASCGVPLVTTRVGNMPDLVVHGENGFFVDPTPSSIVATFRYLKGQDRGFYLWLSRRIREDILRDWTWEKNAGHYRPVMDALLQSTVPSHA